MKINKFLIFVLFILAGCSSTYHEDKVYVYHKFSDGYSVNQAIDKLTQSIQSEADQNGKSWLHDITLYYTDNLLIPDLEKLQGTVEDQLGITVKVEKMDAKDIDVIELLWAININNSKYDNCEDWQIGEFSHYFANSDDFEKFSKSSGCELIKVMADNDS